MMGRNHSPEGQEVKSTPAIGDVVTYTDHIGRRLNALITAVWDGGHLPGQGQPSLNVVYVDPDESKTDIYGRQIGRDASSVPHKTDQAAPGYFWE